MNAASHFLLLMCLMILPAGCRQEASTGGAPERGETGAAVAPDAMGGAGASVPEQAELKETRVFLDGGGDANARDGLGSTRLMDAALKDFGDVVTLLVAKGASVDGVDGQLGQTALHFSACSDSVRAAEALIQQGANVNAADRRGRTPLHEAAGAGSLGVLKVLLRHQADVKTRDAAGKTPIDRAQRARQQEAVSLLLAAGSEPPRPLPSYPSGGATVATTGAPSAPAPVPPPLPAGMTATASKETSVPSLLTGTFPEKPFNGMQIEYRLEGAKIESSRENEDFTNSRTLTGRVTGDTLRVSGRVGMGSGDRAEAHVRLRSGPSNVDLPLALSAGAGSMNWREFDLSVPVDAEAATVAIEVIGTYKAGQRRLLITGDFGPDAAAPAAHPTAEAAGQIAKVSAAGDLAEMVLWWEGQPWVRALKKSMPRGVRILMHAEPYDAEGWSEVELREEHAPDSGFDPNVSPMVGIFRVSRAGRKVEWMEPVSGEFQPIAEFIKQRNLAVATPGDAMPGAGAVSKAPSVTAGDFESEPPASPNQTAPVIVKDPTDPKNHVAVITGPEARGFGMPATVAPGTEALTISLRLLQPEATKLIALADGRVLDGIRLRVQLLDALGHSASGEAVVRPTGQWRDMEFTLYELPKAVTRCTVEASGMKGPIYVDDVRVAKP